MLKTAVILFSLLSAPNDTTLRAAVVTAGKEVHQLSAVTEIEQDVLRKNALINPKQLSGRIPGLHMPDYGASLTSSIYVRGFGSRMENPVIGLYIDDFPVLDKNSYDLDFLDAAAVTFYHGPQGTAYGRNALCGVLSVRTPAAGTRPRLSLSLEGGLASRIQAGTKWGGHSFCAGYRHSRGFFVNTHKNQFSDPYDGLSFRWRWDKTTGSGISLEQLLLAGISAEGGFSYGAWDGSAVQPVNYNDEGSYRRISVLEGVKARIPEAGLDVMASLQLLSDRMRMDQDYTPASIFTLEQAQNSLAGTLEGIWRPRRAPRHWKPVTGFFGFFKGNRLLAPVLFKEDGIRTLILDNANAHIPADIGQLAIPDASFPVDSRFSVLSWNAALYHESRFFAGDWTLLAGLRLDYEGAWMAYDCDAALHYRFVPIMAEAKPFRDTYAGTLAHGSVQLLPKLAAEYRGFRQLTLLVSLAKGYRAGGFNTQIFSDILQNRLMNGLMADLGVYLDRPAVSAVADNTEYQPEELWNLEGSLEWHNGSLRASLHAFAAYALRQQLTVFPPGLTTGRMMTNAGESLSMGLETQLSWQYKGFHAQAAWNWSHARFLVFDDGQESYAGKRIPYSPEHTLFATAGWSGRRFSLQVSLNGVGPIWWNESNTLREPFYLTLEAQAGVKIGRVNLYLRGVNLSGTQYRSFYFKSMGREFFQLGKPLQVIAGLQFTLS